MKEIRQKAIANEMNSMLNKKKDYSTNFIVHVKIFAGRKS